MSLDAPVRVDFREEQEMAKQLDGSFENRTVSSCAYDELMIKGQVCFDLYNKKILELSVFSKTRTSPPCIDSFHIFKFG